MFVTAMAGNPLAVKLAADQGVEISWMDWAIGAFVPGVVCLAGDPAGAHVDCAAAGQGDAGCATALAQRELKVMGPISAKEIVMGLILSACSCCGYLARILISARRSPRRWASR